MKLKTASISVASILALLACGEAATRAEPLPAAAGTTDGLQGPVQSIDSLAEFKGIWAHSEADCALKTSGRLDADDVDRVTSSSYELVGICEDGIDLLYQPVNCGTSGAVRQDDLVELSAACRIKDYVADRRERVLIKVQDPDTILFADPKFMVFGKYVRCTRSYSCDKAWNN
jgi:hypothetical protein